jgi:hypothetical protein
MRYGLIAHHEDGETSQHPYFVVDSTMDSISLGTLGPKFSEAEAEVVAFALNAVSEGLTLYAGHQANEVLTAYTGPRL